MSKVNANSAEPDQTPRSAASDLGLHCLSMSLLWDARLKWIKEVICRNLHIDKIHKNKIHFYNEYSDRVKEA